MFFCYRSDFDSNEMGLFTFGYGWFVFFQSVLDINIHFILFHFLLFFPFPSFGNALFFGLWKEGNTNPNLMCITIFVFSLWYFFRYGQC